jgi:hypothetical protein
MRLKFPCSAKQKAIHALLSDRNHARSLLHRDQLLRHGERRASLGFNLIDGDALSVLDEGEACDGIDVEYSLRVRKFGVN